MAARRPSGKALLAAAAALTAVAGLGAGGWIAATDDDDPARRTTSVATAPGATEPKSEPAPAPPAEPAEPAEGGGQQQQPAPEPSEPTTTEGTRRTSFPSDRRKRRARHIPKRFAIPPAREFSGSGNANLGTVEIRSPAVVKWSSEGTLTIQFGREEFPIVAPSARGELIVPPYSFTKVRVIASGRWKITIKPQT
jgi:hypothetical protein